LVIKLPKIWVNDPGREIRDPEKTFSGSRIQGQKHRIPDPDPQHSRPETEPLNNPEENYSLTITKLNNFLRARSLF
jgi:hypothetical protein